MARGGGIEIPITVDASQLPKARKQIDAFLKGVSKSAGKYSVIDVMSGKEGGKAGAVGSLQGAKGLQRYFDYFAEGAKKIQLTEIAMKKLSVEIKKGDKAAEHYVKTLRMVTTGKQIGSGLAIQVGQFYTQAPKTMQKLIAQWNKYGTQLKDAGLSGKALLDVQAKRDAVGKKIQARLSDELKQTRKLKEEHKGLEGQHRRLNEQYKDTLTYKVRELNLAQKKAKWTRSLRKEVQKEKDEYQRLLHFQRMGLATEKQKVQLVKLSNDLTARGVKLKERETREWRKISKEARKISERRGMFPGGGIMNLQRLGWFIQLRAYWSLYRVLGSLTERLVDLDEATARAMRTTRQAGVTYEDMAQRVETAVKRVAAITGASYRDVGEAQYQLTSAGLTAEEAFAGLSTVMKVAVLTETDVTAATKLVAGVYNNLKDTLGDTVSATEAMQQIGSTLIYTWQNNQVELSELTAALNQSIQSGKQAGLTFNELAIILGNLGTFMIRGGRGGRSMRNVFINLIRDAEKAKDIFHLTREELDISGPIDFIALFRKMSEQWQSMGKEANKFQQAMELVRRRAGEAFVAILEGWPRIEKQLKEVEESHVNIADEIVKLTSRYRTLGKVISAEISSAIDDHANYMNVVKKLGRVVVLTIKQIRASMVHRRPEFIKEAFGGDPAAMEEAAKEFRAYAGLAKLEGYAPESLMVNELIAAAKYLENTAQAVRMNKDLFVTLGKEVKKTSDVLANFPAPEAWGPDEDTTRKITLWQKNRSKLESEWVVLLDKESNVYERLEAARSQYEADWKNFLYLATNTSTEVRGQALKALQKTHANLKCNKDWKKPWPQGG
jgi:TP901 family phage tail tape measure protein